MSTETISRLLDQHCANLTQTDEQEIAGRVAVGSDVADLALRTCSCGRRIDGFYDYVDHLREMLSWSDGGLSTN